MKIYAGVVFVPVVLVLVGCGGDSSISGTGVPADVLLQFPFDGNGNGLTAHGLEITVPDTGIEFVPGVRGQAIWFDGNGAEIQVKGAGELPIQDAMTLEFWFKPEGDNPVRKSRSYICAAHSTTFYVGYVAGSNQLEARLTTVDGVAKLKGKRKAVTDDTWHHIALVYDGKDVLLYLDGDVTAQQPATGMVDLKPKLSFDIGTWYKTNQALYGSLDELRLLNRAMSAEQIAKRMEQTSGETR